nr:MAG TPA: hypothetical protein [Caudoviricetes sp.]
MSFGCGDVKSSTTTILGTLCECLFFIADRQKGRLL